MAKPTSNSVTLLLCALVAMTAAGAAAATFVTQDGFNIDIRKVSGPNVLDESAINSNMQCFGVIQYNVTNVGTSTITSHIGGPIRVTAPSGSDVMLAGPNCWGQPLRNRLNGYLYETTAAAGDHFADGIVVSNIGSYAVPGGWTVFAIRVNCGSNYINTGSTGAAGGVGDTCMCARGSLPNTFDAMLAQ